MPLLKNTHMKAEGMTVTIPVRLDVVRQTMMYKCPKSWHAKLYALKHLNYSQRYSGDKHQ